MSGARAVGSESIQEKHTEVLERESVMRVDELSPPATSPPWSDQYVLFQAAREVG